MYSRYERILSIRGLSNYRVSKDTGIAQTTLSNWKTGKITPRIDAFITLAKYFNVTLDYLVGNSEFDSERDIIDNWKANEGWMYNSTTSPQIPYKGNLIAGFDDYDAEAKGLVPVEEYMARPGEFYALVMNENSMEPTISKGDTVIVSKQSIVENGEIGVIIIDDDYATIKRIYEQKEGINIIADNPTVYPPQYYSLQDMEDLEIEVIGKIVEVRTKF